MDQEGTTSNTTLVDDPICQFACPTRQVGLQSQVVRIAKPDTILGW
jgi:hypothetical protein